MSTQVKMAAQRERPHSETILADECLYQCEQCLPQFSLLVTRLEGLASLSD